MAPERLRVSLCSLTYNCMGHAKEYIDNMNRQLKNSVEFVLYSYGVQSPDEQHFSGEQVPVPGRSTDLNYSAKGSWGRYKKVIMRFLISFRFYFYILKDQKSRAQAQANNQFYFMDYEYFSLVFALFFWPRDTTKLVWIHSASTSGGTVYFIYKFIALKLLSQFSNLMFVVNGDSAKQALVQRFKCKNVSLIQYPSELSLPVENKEQAKLSLGLGNQFVVSMIGMIRRNKNYLLAIDAYSKSKFARSNQHTLLIAGAPADVSEIEIIKALKTGNIKNYVTDFGYHSEAKLCTLFSASDVLLLPYGKNSSSQSGPLSLARNFLLPTIVQSGGEMGDYVIKESVGYIFNEFEDLTEVLNRAVENNPEEMKIQLVSAQKRYSWSEAALKYLKIFRRGEK